MSSRLYPKEYYARIDKINIQHLLDIGIKGLILDVDNTLIDKRKKMPKEIEDWILRAKSKGLKMCIVSNSDKKEKVRSCSR